MVVRDRWAWKVLEGTPNVLLSALGERARVRVRGALRRAVHTTMHRPFL